MLRWRHFFRPKCVPLFLLLTAPAAFCGAPGQHEAREGDEIVAAGQFFHTGTKVVLWMDPGGYDAYRVERRFAPMEQADWENSRPHLDAPQTPNRYGMRDQYLTKEELERVRGGGWDLPTLQSNIDQFVLHFDETGLSRACFKIIHDTRDLSVHFLLDLDGTIYQTLDVKERARHATSSNNRSVGVEIANVGAYPDGDKKPLEQWYKRDATGRMTIVLPASFGPHPVLTTNFTGRPARRELIAGEVQSKKLRQYDFTPQQYEALAKLTATLCLVFPKIKCDYPREAGGQLLTHKLPAAALEKYEGVLGHYHIQTDKVDPGPALQWDYVIGEARRLMNLPPARNTAGQTVLTPPQLMVDD